MVALETVDTEHASNDAADDDDNDDNGSEYNDQADRDYPLICYRMSFSVGIVRTRGTHQK